MSWSFHTLFTALLSRMQVPSEISLSRHLRATVGVAGRCPRSAYCAGYSLRSQIWPLSPNTVQRAAPAPPFFVVITITPFSPPVPSRGPAPPFLGRDHDPAVGRRGAVERRRRRALHHLDVLDFFRIDVVDAIRRRATDAGTAGPRARHPDAVNDVDRVIGERERAGATNAHAAPAARHVRREDLDARHLGRQQVAEVLHRRT